DEERAKSVAHELRSVVSGAISGGDNLWALRLSEIVLLSVPYTAHASTLQLLAPELGSRVLIDITVPLQPPKVSTVNLPAGQAAALEAQTILGSSARVVAALHHVSA